jgi:hypothetical protein
MVSLNTMEFSLKVNKSAHPERNIYLVL